jgi:hypothetical protein
MSEAMSLLSDEIVNSKRKKITLATFKSWIRKNEGSIFINVKSEFDGMTDGCEPCRDGFKPADQEIDHSCANNMGIDGCWLVLGGGDHFTHYETDTHLGIEVSNCCGRFIVATEKTWLVYPKDKPLDACHDPIVTKSIGKDVP